MFWNKKKKEFFQCGTLDLVSKHGNPVSVQVQYMTDKDREFMRIENITYASIEVKKTPSRWLALDVSDDEVMKELKALVAAHFISKSVARGIDRETAKRALV